MEDPQIIAEYALRTRRLKMSLSDGFWYYLPVTLLVFCAVFPILNELAAYREEGVAVSFPSGMRWFCGCALVGGVVFLMYRIKALKFNALETGMPQEEIRRRLEKYAAAKHLKIEAIQDNVIVFILWRRRVTVVFDGCVVLVNSSEWPGTRPSFASDSENVEIVKRWVSEGKADL